MKQLLAALVLMIAAHATFGAEMNGVKFDETIKVDGKDLVMNGMCLRKKVVFGLPVKVYVGALYLTKKSENSDEIMNSPEVKQLSLEFLLAVDREKLLTTFSETYTNQCVADCANASKQFVQIRDATSSVRKGDRMIYTFYPDKFIFEIIGANAKKIEIKDPNVAKNALAMFMNPKAPPTPEFRDGILGKPCKP